MKVSQVVENIFRLHADIHDILFEGFWPIPYGISLNSYIVKGEKSAIIDGLCNWEGVPEQLFEQLNEMKIDINDIDYIVLNHLEPDHTGWLEAFKKLKSDAKIIATQKGIELVSDFYGITENLICVKSGDRISLGNGMELMFQAVPNVHWPETMVTYETKTQTLFTADAFGSFGTSDNEVYDDLLKKEDIDFFEREALRYYANIIGPFSMSVKKAIEEIKKIQICTIAPAHGIIWRRNPQKIIDDYWRYASYMRGTAKPVITLIWASMYGMTGKAVEAAVKGVESAGVQIAVHRVPETHISHLLQSVWESSGVIIGTPTYEYKLFPPMAWALDEIGKKKALNRLAFRFGSYGWSGGAQKELIEIIEKNQMNWQFLDPVEFRGAPKDQDLKLIKQKCNELACLVKEKALSV